MGLYVLNNNHIGDLVTRQQKILKLEQSQNNVIYYVECFVFVLLLALLKSITGK